MVRAALLAALAWLAMTPAWAGDAALLASARLGQLAELRKALDAGADPNDFDHGYSPLMFAAGNGQVEAVRLLLAKGAKTEHRDHNGDRALLWAAERGHIQTVRLLLDAGSPPDSDDDPYDITPLMKASHHGRIDIARLLLARGADVRRRDHTDETALHGATQAGVPALVALLLKAGADPNGIGEHILDTPLANAAERNSPEILRQLVAAGAHLETRDYKGRTALWLAASRDHAASVETLLDLGAKPDARDSDGTLPFTVAAAKGEASAALLVERTQSLDEALVAASWSNRPRLMERLVARGADVNAVDAGRCVLAGSVAHEGPATFDWLLVHGADIRRHGPETLAVVASAGRLDLARRLLAAGISANARGPDGAPALIGAAAQGRTEVVRLLLEHGADPLARDMQGRNAQAWMDAFLAGKDFVIGQREGSRAYRPTDDLRAERDALRAAHIEIAALLQKTAGKVEVERPKTPAR
jgi:ankyrin repeat protein